MYNNNLKNDILNHSEYLIDRILHRAHKKGYVCPHCGNGSGDDGTGLSFDPSKNAFHCFKCGEHGDIFHWTMLEKNCDFKEALHFCADLLGINSQNPAPIPPPVNPKNYKYNFHKINLSDKFKFWHDNLLNSNKALSVIKSWHLDQFIDSHFGYDDSKIDQGKDCITIRHNDYFCTRRVIGFAQNDQRFDYLKGIPVEMFNAEALSYHDTVFVVEGAKDALSIMAAGFNNVVALGGAGQSMPLIRQLKSLEHPPNLILLLDPDQAGRDASESLIDKLKKININYQNCTLPLINDNIKTDANDWLIHDKQQLSTILQNFINDSHFEHNFEEMNSDMVNSTDNKSTKQYTPDNLNQKTDWQTEMDALQDKLDFYQNEFDKALDNAPKKLSVDIIDDFIKRGDFGDLACANLFVDIFGDDIKFNRNTNMWSVWCDNKWVEVTEKSNNRDLQPMWEAIAYTIYHKARLNEVDLDIKLLYGNKFAKVTINDIRYAVKRTDALVSSIRMNSVLNTVKGNLDIARWNKQFDAYDNVLNCKNGEITLNDLTEDRNVPAFEFSNSYDRNKLITSVMNVSYNKDAVCPQWNNFMKHLIPDSKTRILLQKYVGASLLGGNPEEVFFWFCGKGGTGKNTFFEALIGVFGDYSTTLPMQLFCKSRKESTGEEANPHVMKFSRCRIGFASENEKNRQWNMPFIKEVTGSSTITARGLYRPPVEFVPKTSFFFSGNYIPVCVDPTDDGLRRRLRIIECNHKPKKVITNLKKVFASEEAKSAILNWVLNGYRLYILTKALGNNPFDEESLSDEMKKSLDRYFNSSDNVAEFINVAELNTGNNCSVAVKFLYNLYIDWAKKVNQCCVNYHEFISLIRRHFPDVKFESKAENRRQNMFYGIAA